MLLNDVMIDSRAARRVARLRLVAAVATSASGDRQRTLDGNVPVELAVEVAQQTEHQLTIDSAVVQLTRFTHDARAAFTD